MSPVKPRPSVPKPKVPPVTIVLGFTCKDGIVLACDSQISNPESTRKQTGVAKLARVDFAGSSVLVAKAGSLWMSSYFQEFFEKNARHVPLTDYRVVTAIAEQTMREVKTRLIDAFLPEQPDSEAIQQRVRDYSYVVMLAYYCQGKPHIFTLASYAGIAIRETHSFSAAGCGDSLASYVLTGIDTAKLSSHHALALATYTVDVCKRHDAGCGGDVQVGTVSGNDGTCAVYSGRDVFPYDNTATIVASWGPHELVEKIKRTFDDFYPIFFNNDGTRRNP